jgi:hypothetical protein
MTSSSFAIQGDGQYQLGAGVVRIWPVSINQPPDDLDLAQKPLLVHAALSAAQESHFAQSHCNCNHSIPSLSLILAGSTAKRGFMAAVGVSYLVHSNLLRATNQMPPMTLLV